MKVRNQNHPVYDVAKKSPLQLARKLSETVGHTVLLKREDLQSVHSFKLRGAYNKIRSLSAKQQACGVIAASAGNHAQGVALSAKKLGIKALIVMPKTTPSIKIDGVRSLGAEVELAGDSYSEAYEYCKQRITETGMAFVHPFDDPLVIAGQGTIADELVEQRPDITHVFVPIGGGGLIAGVAKRLKELKPDIVVVGVEPVDSNAMQQSVQAGKIVELSHVGIFADGVAVKRVGELSFNIAGQYVDEFITVSTDETCAAIKSIFEDTRSIVEPSGALAVAGITAYKLPQDTVAVALCTGANMTFERLQFVAERTLLGSGKEALFAVTLQERPNALKAFCEQIIAGHNITEFNYRLNKRDAAHIFVGIGVSGPDDVAAFCNKMKSYAYTYIDLTLDDTAKEHIRHMVGGPAPSAKNEKLFSVGFPERPGALLEFLSIAGNSTVNISLFHYRGQGGDTGRVLIGFENPENIDLLNLFKHASYDIEPANGMAIQLFLK